MVGVRVFVGNLPYLIGEAELRELLSRVADVQAVSLPLDPVTHHPRGFALIDVASETDARDIIREFNGYVLDARRLRVERAREPEMAAYVPRYRPRRGVKGRPPVRPHRPERSPSR